MDGQQQAPQSRPATEVVSGIHDGFLELASMLDQSQKVQPQDKQALAQLIQGFRSFVQNNLGGGGQQQPQQEAPGTVSPEQGGSNEAVPVG